MEVGGNGNSRWMMNGNNCGIQMGAGMGMNERESEEMGMKVNSRSCLVYMTCGQWRSQGFQSGELRGRVREGVYPLPLGIRGLCPRKNFQITDARR
jgi:hypothetical protein